MLQIRAFFCQSVNILGRLFEVILSYPEMKLGLFKIGLAALALFAPTAWAQPCNISPAPASCPIEPILQQVDVENFVAVDQPEQTGIAASPAGRSNSAPRLHRRRGKKLNIQRAQLPTIRCFSPVRYLRSFSVRIEQEPDGPNLSRAPPSNLPL